MLQRCRVFHASAACCFVAYSHCGSQMPHLSHPAIHHSPFAPGQSSSRIDTSLYFPDPPQNGQSDKLGSGNCEGRCNIHVLVFFIRFQRFPRRGHALMCVVADFLAVLHNRAVRNTLADTFATWAKGFAFDKVDERFDVFRFHSDLSLAFGLARSTLFCRYTPHIPSHS